MRLSQKNEDGKRTRHRQPTSQTRPKNSDCLAFPKTARILSRGHYHAVLKAGRKLFGQTVIMDYRIGKSMCPKLGITVSRRYGKAHLRNRFKRVVREAFRHCYLDFPQNLELNVNPRRPMEKVSRSDIIEDLSQLLKVIPHAKP